MKTAIIAFSVSLALAGCVTPPKKGFVVGSRPGQGLTVANVTIIDDPFQNFVEFNSPEIFHEDYDHIYKNNTSILRSWININGGNATHQILINHQYPACELHNWHSANDEDKNSLPFFRIEQSDRKCDSASTTIFQYEAFAAGIKDSVLREKINTGYSVKFYARSGATKMIFIPKEVIQIQLEAVDGRLALLRTHQNSGQTNPTSTTSRKPDSRKPTATVKQGQDPT